MIEPVLTVSDLIRDLRSLGISSGNIVLVHSSLSSLGRVEGGAETVIAGLLEVIGPAGTLMMPSFQKGGEYSLSAAGCIFDVRVSPTAQGLIPETFRKRPGTIRSLSPTHCMAAFGKDAAKLLEGHESCSVSVGKNSPFDKLIQLGGKILLLGVTNDVNTTLHYLENVNGAPTVSRNCFNPIVIDHEGKARVVPTYPHMPGLNRCYGRVEDEFISEGIQTVGKVGAAVCRLIDAAKMNSHLAPRIRQNPLCLIDVFTP